MYKLCTEPNSHNHTCANSVQAKYKAISCFYIKTRLETSTLFGHQSFELDTNRCFHVFSTVNEFVKGDSVYVSAYRKYLKVVRKARKPEVIALWPGYKRRGTWFVIIDYAEKKDYGSPR